MQITDYVKELDGKKYATYECVNASYSYSRSAIVFVMDMDNFKKTHLKIPEFFSLKKQEYTDVYLLGIEGFDSKNSTETDKNITNLFYQKIIKYRSCNDLPEYTIEQLAEQTKLITKEDDLCNYLACPIPKKKKATP